VPLLGVLPGTGGLTRLIDKRKVRRDQADFFCTTAEGIKGARAVEWKLVDAIAPKSTFDEAVAHRVGELAKSSTRLPGKGIVLSPISKVRTGNAFAYEYVNMKVDEAKRVAEITIQAPGRDQPQSASDMLKAGAELWALKAYRELDDAILQLRFNFHDIGVIVFRTLGDPLRVLAAEKPLMSLAPNDWFAKEVLLHMKRVLKRIDVTSRSLVTLIEQGSAFAGSLAELAFAADRSYMLDVGNESAALHLSPINNGLLPMGNELSRLQARYFGEPEQLGQVLRASLEGPIGIEACKALGLVTFSLDDIDYEDEVRLFLEERASLSPDALTGMEANLRFVGPETMETKIFARLSAWQNWIFIRDNATGEKGALTNYGKPTRPQFDFERC
jgi:benzoyl-CoA-dihydrodiol lyase